MAKKKVVAAFGYFDGVHTGHLRYLKEAKKLGGELVVFIGRDKAKWKPPKAFKLNENERKKLVEQLGVADRVILGSVKHALEKVVRVKPDIIAITRYHPVDPEVLREELKRHKLNSKVVVI